MAMLLIIDMLLCFSLSHTTMNVTENEFNKKNCMPLNLFL